MTINNTDKNKKLDKKTEEKENNQGHESNKFISFLSMTACLAFLFILFCTLVFPEYLPFFGLNVKMCYMIVLQLISFIFVLSTLQTPHLDFKWQMVCLIFALILVGESYFILLS